MSSLFTLIAVYALLVFGVIFCFFGRFPGQILAYAGLLLAHFTAASAEAGLRSALRQGVRQKREKGELLLARSYPCSVLWLNWMTL